VVEPAHEVAIEGNGADLGVVGRVVLDGMPGNQVGAGRGRDGEHRLRRPESGYG
jgi:outer membrane lipoprotein SlyB